MNLQILLNQPFNYISSSKHKRFYIISSSVFALVFLIVYQPYGISEQVSSPLNPIENIVFFFVSITLNVFIGLSLSQFVFRKPLNFENVTNKKYIIWFFVEVLILTLLNFSVSFIIPDLGNDFERELNLSFQIGIFFKIFIVLLFPFFGTIIYVLIQQLSIEVKELGAQIQSYKYQYNLTHKQELLKLKDENDNLDFSIELRSFLFAEASNQYIVIHYLKAETVKKHIVRNRMKNFLIETKHLPIKQCHRSYAVNLLNVNYMTRINGKEFLMIDTIEPMRVPISKTFLTAIKATIPQTE